MGRGQRARGDDPVDPSTAGMGVAKSDLLEAGGLSSKTFDMIRKAARVRGPAHGGLTHEFSIDEVRLLIRTAGGGKFTERGAPAVEGWRALLRERGVRVD